MLIALNNQAAIKNYFWNFLLSKKFVLIFLFSYCIIPETYSQVLSLDSVLSRIENNNPALLSYTNKIAGANERVNSVRTWMPTMIGVQAGDNPYSFDFKNNTYQAMFVAEQWFPNGKRNTAKENYFKSFASIKQNEYDYLKNQLFAKAKETYYERYITEKKIQIIKDNIELMKAMVDISEKHLSSGMEDLGSIYKTKARLTDSQTMLLHEENMVKSLTVTLNYLMNSDVNQQFDVDTNNLVKNYREKNLFPLKDSLALIRSDIQRINSEISNTTLNRTLMSLQSKPEYGFRFEHTAMFSGKDLYAAMFMVSVPIFSKSSRGYKSEVKAMGFEISAMEQDKQAMLNMANQMVTMIVLELNTEYAEVDNYRNKVIPAYKKSFDTNLLSYSQNTGELMKALLAWDDLQMAQMKYLEHLGILLKAQAEYEKEMQIR
ncbi:MAG TPA: TolC family protein [Bacteroidia bacterium]|nr:TolC family protein [Bacteroidia bacterium]